MPNDRLLPAARNPRSDFSPTDAIVGPSGVAALILALLAIQGCTTFVAGDPASPGGWVYQLPLQTWPWENLSVYGGPGDRKYLGCLRCPGSGLSLDNPHGQFRTTSANKFFNSSGVLGNQGSNYSPCNRHGTSPPVVFTSNGALLGRLTVNRDLPDAVQLPSLQAWIADACVSADATAGTEKGHPVPGVPQDRAEGDQSRRKAAGAGNAGSHVRLGRVDFTGLGASQDDADAVKRLRRAAERGATLAQYDLGKRYADGRGAPLDPGETFMWATLAATLSVGDEQRKCIDFRDSLAATLTPTQIREAQKRARGWLAAFENGKK